MQPLAALGFSSGPEISYIPKAALKFTANKANIKTSSSVVIHHFRFETACPYMCKTFLPIYCRVCIWWFGLKAGVLCIYFFPPCIRRIHLHVLTLKYHMYAPALLVPSARSFISISFRNCISKISYYGRWIVTVMIQIYCADPLQYGLALLSQHFGCSFYRKC